MLVAFVCVYGQYSFPFENLVSFDSLLLIESPEENATCFHNSFGEHRAFWLRGSSAVLQLPSVRIAIGAQAFLTDSRKATAKP